MTSNNLPNPTPAQPVQPSKALWLFLILPLFGILAALVMLVINPTENRGASIETVDILAPRLLNYPAPNFALTDLDGRPVQLSDYARRPLLINFWQTTCEPCIREMPAFQEFIQSQGEDGVAVLAINFEETSEQVQAFFSKIKVMNIRVALDTDSTVRKAYGVFQIPVTFAIDAQGTVQAMKLGAMTLEEMESYAAIARGESQ